MRKMILTAFLGVLVTTTSQAQFDDLDGFAPPPPPAPSMPAMGRMPPDKKATEPSVVPANKKEKLAKSSIEDITNENFPETIESFDFPNADITDIVKAMSELTGKNFIIDQGVRGKITIIAPSKITVAEAYKAFLSALAINGFAVVPSGNFLKVRSARNAQRDGIETYSGNYYPTSDQMITRIIHLKHISAEMVNRDLRILTSKDGELSMYTPTNSLIVSDYGSNIERIMKIIGQLDVPGFEDQLEVLPIRYAKAKDIAELVNKIVNKDDSRSRPGMSSSPFSAGVPRFSRPTTPQSGSSSSYFMVIPDDRTNSLIIVGNKAGIARVKKLVSQLDFRIRPEDSGGVFVYYIKHGEAEKIAQTLSGIAKEAGPKPTAGGGPGGGPLISPVSGVQATTQEIFGGDVKITADKSTNSLVVVASKQDYEVVLNLLSKLDIPRDQVFVEAYIVEMNLSDDFSWETATIQYSNGYGKAGFIGMKSQTLQDILNPTAGGGAILGFSSGGDVTVKVPSATAGSAPTTMTMPNVLSFVNFLKKNANANVLSNPQVMALDNQEAEIEAGDKIVVAANQTAATPTSGSVSTPIFEDATIKLKIKPFISKTEKTVRMELEGQVKQITTAQTPKDFQNSTTPLATRKIKTNIVVPSGDTAVLGGLMKESEIEQIAKVPLLGDIPILGWLFKSRTVSKQKTNLLVLLTPRILSHQADGQSLLSKKMDQRLNFIKAQGGRDAFGETMDQLTRKEANGATLQQEVKPRESKQ